MATSTQLTLTSSAFDEGGSIPARYTCSGADQSPPLEWSGAPDGTSSFALIVDDPDAGGFIHWVAHHLPGNSSSLEENAASSESIRQGRNSFGSVGWRGPCPPSGVHRYQFTIYALDASLSLSGAPSADDLRRAMQGHVLGEGRLTGRFGR